MDKLDMESKSLDITLIDKLEQILPNIVINKDNNKRIDFDLLKQELSKNVSDDYKEKYQLTWPGKIETIINVNTPTKSTLRPIKAKSIDFENTKNIYIEGDNLESLKILQESYLNKVKVIYIDPPYNTGNDFIYNDDYRKNTKDELIESGQIDEEGNRLVSNRQSNGKFHSDWLSMIYSRIKLARNLLTDDGVMFISIDDNELKNLLCVCDEIFGESNFVANIIWQMRYSVSNDVQWFSSNTENIIVYAKNKSIWSPNQEPRNDKMNASYKNIDNDSRGRWSSVAAQAKSGSQALKYGIETPSGEIVYPPEGRYWAYSKETYNNLLNDNRIYFATPNSRPRVKKFLSEVKDGKTPQTLWTFDEVGHTQTAKKELDLLMNCSTFDTPKPVSLITKILDLTIKSDNDLVMDFFSGSATTAQAVMEYNAKHKKKIKYIMIQLAEKCDVESNAYKNGYETICDIGESRINKSGKKIKEDTNADIDYGFRVYKIDSSNMKDVFYKPNDINQDQLRLFESNIKEDRTNDDLLTQVILDLGLPLDLSIKERTINNNKVYYVDDSSLVACFDNHIDLDIVDEIAKCDPFKVVFKDESFKLDNDKINLMEKFKKLSPDTEISIL
ncbi:MAG TPA: site-specific DNA-methyltransferase [Bacilli bacterium]|nr:site-specific DNA-methyltransferase [Bacilli bacterium]